MSKIRINISIDARLHDWAQKHAKARGATLSGYLSHLIRQDRDGLVGLGPSADAQKAALRAEVAEELLAKLLQQRPAK